MVLEVAVARRRRQRRVAPWPAARADTTVEVLQPLQSLGGAVDPLAAVHVALLEALIEDQIRVDDLDLVIERGEVGAVHQRAVRLDRLV